MGFSRLKFNTGTRFALALGMSLKFQTSVANELKIKARNFCRQNPRLVEVAKEKLLGGQGRWSPHPE